jgi:hypothetical protein
MYSNRNGEGMHPLFPQASGLSHNIIIIAAVIDVSKAKTFEEATERTEQLVPR